jgi:DNA-binding XRE family transcriptional regulator
MYFNTESLIALRTKLGFNRHGFAGILAVPPINYNRIEADPLKANPTISLIIKMGMRTGVNFIIGKPGAPVYKIESGEDLARARGVRSEKGKGNKFTQVDAAEMSGVNFQSILKLELDRQVTGGRLETITKLADCYGVALEYTPKYLETIERKAVRYGKKAS